MKTTRGHSRTAAASGTVSGGVVKMGIQERAESDKAVEKLKRRGIADIVTKEKAGSMGTSTPVERSDAIVTRRLPTMNNDGLDPAGTAGKMGTICLTDDTTKVVDIPSGLITVTMLQQMGDDRANLIMTFTRRKTAIIKNDGSAEVRRERTIIQSTKRETRGDRQQMSSISPDLHWTSRVHEDLLGTRSRQGDRRAKTRTKP